MATRTRGPGTSAAPANQWRVRVASECLTPLGVQSGDLVVVDLASHPRNGDLVVAVSPESQLVVKQYFEEGGHVVLASPAPGHPATFTKLSEIVILGVVSSFDLYNRQQRV
ncbi:MAG: S24 family peptidase [Chloroflexota bacterium]